MPHNNEEQRHSIPMTEFIAQNVEAGNFRTVDIVGERQKAKLMGVEEFADKLSGYRLSDYLNTEKPYYDLLEFSRAQPGLFEQFAAVLTGTAKSRMRVQNTAPYEKTVADNIAFYRNVLLPDLTEAASILDFINIVENDPETADQVKTVLFVLPSGETWQTLQLLWYYRSCSDLPCWPFPRLWPAEQSYRPGLQPSW